jgi:radical S-adenosyl methionine domain-containing protein 2
MLKVEGENEKAASLAPSDEQFEEFKERNTTKTMPFDIITEDTEEMTGSYLMIAPDGRFFFNIHGKHEFSEPILKVGLHAALEKVPLRREYFFHRKGDYCVS